MFGDWLMQVRLVDAGRGSLKRVRVIDVGFRVDVDLGIIDVG